MIEYDATQSKISTGKTNNILNKFKSFNISEKIILVNVILFVIPFFLKSIFYLFDFPVSSLMGWFKLSPEIITFIYRPWTLITYSFIHGGINHVLYIRNTYIIQFILYFDYIYRNYNSI